jgi:hypothetical protein
MIRDLMEKDVVVSASARVRSQLLAHKTGAEPGTDGESPGVNDSEIDESIQKIDEWKAG